MRRRRFLVSTACGALLAGCGLPLSSVVEASSNEGASELAAMVSRYRAGRGLGPVAVAPALNEAALRQSVAMAAVGELSHAAAGSFASRIDASGLAAARAAENIGVGYRDHVQALAGWRASPAHDANLLMPEATRIGYAWARRHDGRVFHTLVLAAA